MLTRNAVACFTGGSVLAIGILAFGAAAVEATEIQGDTWVSTWLILWDRVGSLGIILVAVGVVAWRVARWVRPKVDRAFDAYMNFVDRVAASQTEQTKILERQAVSQDEQARILERQGEILGGMNEILERMNKMMEHQGSLEPIWRPQLDRIEREVTKPRS